MQTHVLTPQVNLAEDNLRLCYRVAMKSRLHLQAAGGLAPPPSGPYLPDSAAIALFAQDPEMAVFVNDLERKRFRAADWESRKFKILERSLAAVAEFYRELPVPLDAKWNPLAVGRPAQSIMETHRSELRLRVEAEPALQAIAESIIVYPTPHWAPAEYQIDLILKDAVPSTAFGDAVRAIRRSFEGRTFGIHGTHAQITMVPRSAYEHPWFFLGTPLPFLHEHVASFGIHAVRNAAADSGGAFTRGATSMVRAVLPVPSIHLALSAAVHFEGMQLRPVTRRPSLPRARRSPDRSPLRSSAHIRMHS